MGDDHYGFDFNNDGKVSFEESHLTYHIERETIRKNSGNYTSHRNNTRNGIANDNNTSNTSKSSNWIIYLILGASALGWILFFYRKSSGYFVI